MTIFGLKSARVDYFGVDYKEKCVLQSDTCFFHKHRVNPTWGSDMLFFRNWASKYAYPYAYFSGISIKILHLRRNEICALFYQGKAQVMLCLGFKSWGSRWGGA